ncbi:META domain-containing protein [Devosia algicola]|uniref:META domain-containing protein n=1 Tax=Devosia algicola TaxID=3026418 RepID=A0ABY7YSF5_9HYPH|nr:META domain-containing protein [Devosia algicola]WDR04122.1 META domain-containing protein [Devosia algicola]
MPPWPCSLWLGCQHTLPSLSQHVTGQITYRERVALPPNSSLRMAIVDIAKPDFPEIVVATAAISPTGQVPLQFDFSVQSRLFNANGQFGVTAQIIADNQVWFATARPVPIRSGSTPALLLTLSMADTSNTNVTLAANSPSVRLAVSGELFDTQWQIVTIAGNPVIGETDLSFSIATDHRGGGNAGCNSYFAQINIDGQQLTVGPIAATRMACAPAVMVQEAALFAALENVWTYKLTKSELVLLGTDGAVLLKLHARRN